MKLKGGIQDSSAEEKALEKLDNLHKRVQNIIKELEPVTEGEKDEDDPIPVKKRKPTDIEIRKFLNVYYDMRELPNILLKDIPSEKEGKRNPNRDKALEHIDDIEVIIDPLISEMKPHITEEQIEHVRSGRPKGGRKHKTRKARKQLKKNKTRKA